MGVTRRGFTAGLAGTLLAAPFTRLLTGTAHAQDGGAGPRRFMVFYGPNGTVHAHWRPQGTPQDYRFQAGGVLEPLAARKAQLLLVDGLDFATADNHEGGQAAMLTNGGGERSPTRGASLDQVIADHIGGQSRFPSLELGVLTDIWGAGRQTRMSYRAGAEIVHPDADPRRVFERLFGAVAGSPEALARTRALRQSVLDTARDELADLHRRVGRAERQKLEAHLDALRSVEQQLFAEQPGTCDAPQSPARLNKDRNDDVPALLDAQLRLAVQALACGHTRVASVQLSHTVSPVVYSWLGIDDGHHALSHADDHQVAKVQQFVACERWVAERFDELLGLLAATPDPDVEGASLLDTTLVLWPKEMGDPRLHTCRDVPFVLAGGGIRGGRWLQVDTHHARLLVSICQLFGLPLDTFGDPQAQQGPLAGVA
ncbi:MAG: DUF1552 domain-containing protein [Myxococcales bacterium]|nr:DUF1552 domain-containing protein [Myxococcales bacterium]